MKETVLNNLLAHNFNKDIPTIISVSTGVDSMVLLDIIYKLNLDIIVVHFNHNKREQSIEEETFIKEYCDQLDIKLYVNHINEENPNFQNNARLKRYTYLEEVAIIHNTDQVLVAHHGNDNIETILIKILRGSNIKGYSGLKFKTKINNIYIYRPLLSFSKDDIYKYSTANRIKYFEDESNNDESYLRNNIRVNYVNTLVENFDTAISKFNEYTSNLDEINNYINIEVEKYYNDKMTISTFNKLDIVIKKGIISKMCQSSFEIDRSKLDDIISFIGSKKFNVSIDLGNNYRLIKEYNVFYISNFIELCETLVYVKNENTVYKINDDLSIILNPNNGENIYNAKIICYNEISNFLTIRNRKDGDFITMPYGSKKIKNLFIDMKIPTRKRNEILLIVNGDSNEVLYIFDLNIINNLYKEKLVIK